MGRVRISDLTKEPDQFRKKQPLPQRRQVPNDIDAARDILWRGAAKAKHQPALGNWCQAVALHRWYRNPLRSGLCDHILFADSVGQPGRGMKPTGRGLHDQCIGQRCGGPINAS